MTISGISRSHDIGHVDDPDLFSSLVSVAASTCSIYPLYPYGEDRGDALINEEDDVTAGRELNYTFNFFGHDCHQVFMDPYGTIAFRQPKIVSPTFRYLEIYISVFLTSAKTKILYRKGNTFQLVLASDGNKTIVIHNYGLIQFLMPAIYAQLFFSETPRQIYYPISSLPAMADISDYSNVDFPGRIVTRIDGSIVLSPLDSISCGSCTVDRNSGRVKSFDGANDLSAKKKNRKFLISKADEDGEVDQCQYKLSVVTDSDGLLDWVSFSVGVRSNKRKYKRNFTFGRHTADQVLIRGHQVKKRTITSFPYYEFISDDLQQLVVMVEERAGGWIVRSPCCPYKLTYNPVDESEQVHLYLSPYYGSRTIGMCQNYNNIVTDENQRCTNPPQNGTSTEIIDSCSCPKRDKTCMN
ncbi:hypothetical protein LSH36_657g02014 [Paralvinella palmiformis]|uniref:NIDO domain-containing protein n=1 Tax=Paralvinella palmiformis TaxID=53620 RepID=A0AAD9J387_9ANNE|nr:hypothetical protein LSH36_657g02014 [Paralvinella palmiformis]